MDRDVCRTSRRYPGSWETTMLRSDFYWLLWAIFILILHICLVTVESTDSRSCIILFYFR